MSYNPFYQIQYFSKFYSALSYKYSGIHPNKIFQWSKGPIKYRAKLFMADGEQTVLGKFIGALFNMRGLMIRSTANHEGIYTWRWSPDRSTELWKYLFLIVESFVRNVVSWLTWPWCFICKVNSTNRYCFRKIHSAHCVLGVGDFMQCLF